MQEGDASPADVFLTENSPAMSRGRERRACSPRSTPAAVEPDPGAVPARRAACGPASSPARPCSSTTPSLVDEAELPDSIMDLAEPGVGRADLVLADRRRLPGDRRRRARPRGRGGHPGLAGRARRPTAPSYDGNNVVLESVNAGESAVGIIYHYYWYRDQAESGDEQRQQRALLLRQPGPRRLRQRLRRGRARSPATTRTRRSSSSSTSPARRASRRSPTATRWSTRSTRPSSLEPAVKPFAELEPPTVDDLRPRRRQGRRADDGGRVPLSASSPRATGVLDASAAPASLVVLGSLVAAISLVPLGLRRRLDRPARLRRGATTSWSGRASGSCCGTPTGCSSAASSLSAVARRRRAPGWSSAPTCPARAVARRAVPRRSPYPRSSTATAGSPPPTPCRATPARCWSSACPTTRSSTCRPWPRCAASTPGSRRSRPRSATDRWPTFLRVVLPAISPAVLGGALLVGLHLLAEYGALQLLNYPTLTTGDPRPVPHRLQRPGGHPAGRSCWSCSACCCSASSCSRGAAAGARGSGAGVEPASDPASGSGAALRPCRRRPGRGSRCSRSASRCCSLVRWLVRGTSTTLPAGDLSAGDRSPRSAWRWPAALLATVAALPVAWLAVRHRGPLADARGAQRLPRQRAARASWSRSPWSRSRSGRCPALYQTLPLLLLGYAILFLPRAVVSVRSTLELAPPVLEDVARSLGCTGAAGRPTGDPAAGAARARGQHGPRLARRLHRADRHAAARADRHLDPGHRVLVARLRRSRTAPPRRTPCCSSLLSVPATWLLGAATATASGRPRTPPWSRPMSGAARRRS